MAKRSRSRYRKQKQQTQYMIYGIMSVVLILVIGLIAYSQLNAPPDVAEARLETEAVRGMPGAPVQIVEYGAYGCTACRSVHESGILQQVMERYGDSVQFIFRNGLIIHSNDPNGAEAAQCALDQGEQAFWQMHDALFDMPYGEYGRAGDDEFVEVAREAGLDGDALALCLDERTHERTASYWRGEARDDQVRVSPTFFVNGRRLGNAGQLEEAVLAALGQ